MYANADLTKCTPSPVSVSDQDYRIWPKNTPDGDLPYIPPNQVCQRDGKSGGTICKGRLSAPVGDTYDSGVVIDDIVYDCSSFASKHPGGRAVIMSFGGKDCSCKWPNGMITLAEDLLGQFHRIHGLQKTRKWLPHLRVGRTEGVQNPYAEGMARNT